MSKDCFYMDLWAEHKPMVVHLKDCPQLHASGLVGSPDGEGAE